MKDTTIAVDIAKEVFEIAVSYEPGVVRESYTVKRKRFLGHFARRERATVVMEACGSAHHWAREVEKLGHRAVLLPPHAIRPYVQRNKTDRADAKGILEAYRNKEIRCVPVKSLAQHAIAALHRIRSQWMSARTRRINMVRGLLRELGIFIPVGSRGVVPRVLELVEDADSTLADAIRETLYEVCEEIRELERRIRKTEKQLEALSQQIPTVRRLRTIPGVGPLTATALVAFVGDVHRFRSSRHFANYLGLTPRVHSTGNNPKLGHISKQGNNYLRTLLTHGARSVLYRASHLKQPDRLRSWALELRCRRGHNKTVVAIANKMARITCAVWKSEGDYLPQPV